MNEKIFDHQAEGYTRLSMNVWDDKEYSLVSFQILEWSEGGEHHLNHDEARTLAKAILAVTGE